MVRCQLSFVCRTFVCPRILYVKLLSMDFCPSNFRPRISSMQLLSMDFCARTSVHELPSNDSAVLRLAVLHHMSYCIASYILRLASYRTIILRPSILLSYVLHIVVLRLASYRTTILCLVVLQSCVPSYYTLTSCHTTILRLAIL